MVSEPILQNVNKLIVVAGIGWHKEESRVDQIANGVVYDSLHNFAIEKLNPHPYPMDDGRFAIKTQMLVFCVSIEAVDIKDGLDILDWDLLDGIRIEQANPHGLGSAKRSTP